MHHGMRASQRCREKDAPVENTLALPMCVHNPLRIKYFHETLAGNTHECSLKSRIGEVRHDPAGLKHPRYRGCGVKSMENTMTIDEIQQRIRDIENDTDKPEGSLSSQGSNEEYLRQKESYLWYKVLESIADGADNPQALTKEAIKSIYISFERGAHHS